MRPASLLGAVVLWACATGAQTRPATPAPEPSPYRITGTVVSATDGAPIPHAQLRPDLLVRGRSGGTGGGGRRQFPGQFRQFPASGDVIDADERGQFSITLPSAGTWQLTAMASGFVAQAYEEHQEFSSSIVLTPESPTYDLVFRLRPEAVISGEVVDEAGEPVRNAQVSLLSVPASSPDRATDSPAVRGAVQTDDRGVYEFASLSPGDYRVTVQVQPWYATAAQSRRFGPSDASALDPSLDVTYPLTWYPGVDDPAMAETISMHGGDVAQADFHMVPIPSIHLRIVPPAGVSANAPPNGRAPLFPVVERISTGVNGGGGFNPVSMTNISPAGIDVGGLAPGLYQVRLQGQGSDNRVAVVELTAGGVHTLDMNAAPTVANIAIHFDGLTDVDENSLQVVFDSDDGRRVVPMNMEPRGGGNQRGRSGGGMRGQERVVEVAPGRYRVTLVGRPNVYLTGITGQSAEVKGRYVTVHAGDSSLTLHVATGTATVTGIVKSEGKPCVGAMVMLVPATLGDTGSFAFLARDQSNTDGSFDLTNVIPGQYILVAIEDGWHINWSDQSTLRQYLTHGVPMDLGASANVKQNVQAQMP
jgi:hypothetical protein